jgi:hypothetical protein
VSESLEIDFSQAATYRNRKPTSSFVCHNTSLDTLLRVAEIKVLINLNTAYCPWDNHATVMSSGQNFGLVADFSKPLYHAIAPLYEE